MIAKRVSITFGEEVFQPYQYESFRVGPITVDIELAEGETVAEATKRCKEAVGPAIDDLFIFMRDKFYYHHKLKG